MWVIKEATGDVSVLEKVVREMNKPENLEPVYEEIAMAERRLAEYKAADPEGFAEFEEWFNRTHYSGSGPTVLRKR